MKTIERITGAEKMDSDFLVDSIRMKVKTEMQEADVTMLEAAEFLANSPTEGAF